MLAEPVSSSRPDWTQLAIGAATGASGFYFVLVGLHVLSPPSRTDAPGWVVVLCGLVFAYAGLAVIARGVLGLDEAQRDLPETAPTWIKAVYWFGGVAVCAALAGIGSWVAFGPGERHFSMSGPVAGAAGEGVGRAVFGIAAVLTWLIAAALARAGYRKLFGKQ